MEKTMATDTLQKELTELVIDLGMHRHLSKLIGKRTRVPLGDRNYMEVREALDCIRIGVKYLLLEHEASQRENKTFREMLGDSRDDDKE